MPNDQSNIYSENGLRKIQENINVVRIDLGASGAILQDQAGNLLVESGSHGDLNIGGFLALLGNAMSASSAVMELLRDASAFDMHVHEGVNLEMYTSRINDQIFLTLLFEKRTGTSRVGMVWLTLRRAIPEIRGLVERATVSPERREGKAIQSAISSTLTEALNLLDGDVLDQKSPPRAAENPSFTVFTDPADESDPNRTISFEEARRMGLINFDPDSK